MHLPQKFDNNTLIAVARAATETAHPTEGLHFLAPREENWGHVSFAPEDSGKTLIRIGDLEVDAGTRTVKRGGRRIFLTPHEYSLLELLISRQGQIVSRQQMKEHLYKNNKQLQSNVIEAHICYLRAKIDKGFDMPLIQTRWGKGYILRFDDPRAKSPIDQGNRW